MTNNKGSFKGLLPLLAFLILYLAMGVITKDFSKLPLLVGVIIASTVGLLLNNKDKKLSFSDKVMLFCRGGGDKTIILMVVIYMLAGAFYSIARAMHATDTVTNIAIGVLPVKLILPGLFVTGCILSFSMGTSMGTISALMPIAVDIASRTGINLPLICGIVVGGAMFGDNLSFISDTTIAATTTQNITMKDKFKTNFLMVLPAAIVTVVLLAFYPIGDIVVATSNAVNYLNLLPYILIITLSLLGLHVLPAMALSIVSAILVGVYNGDFTFVSSLKIVHEGMTWMQDISILAIFVGGLVALMKYLGGIDWLMYKLSHGINSKVGAKLSIAALVSLIDLATTNNTISIISAGPIAKDISEKFEVSPKETASILDIFSSAVNGVVPYGAQLLAAGTLAGIAPSSIVIYSWYPIFMAIFGLIFILFGFLDKKR